MSADLNWNIGKDGDLLFKSREDLAHFKKATERGVLIMGNSTFKSLPKKLPNRLHLVLTREKNKPNEPDVIYFNSVEEIKKYVNECKYRPWVIGGAQIIELFLEQIEYALITRFDCVVEADTRMAQLDLSDKWVRVLKGEHIMDENGDVFHYESYVRR
jgi:dihydrofolate reductase